MNQFEQLILRWVCLFDDFRDNDFSDISLLVTSSNFQKLVNDVFCYKSAVSSSTKIEQLYNTIKTNYQEFEVEGPSNLHTEENSCYTCVVVLLHALLKCTNNKFRDQLSERMDDKEQVLLAKFLEATQSALFTKQNISEALDSAFSDGTKNSESYLAEEFSNNVTPKKTNPLRRSYLQEFCESPKSQSLIYQEKDKVIAKLTEDYKNECEENYKLAESNRLLEELNVKLSTKLEDKDKVIKFLKDEIEELSKPKEVPVHAEVNNEWLVKKLNQDVYDLEKNVVDLKQQIVDLENAHTDLNAKFQKKNSEYENVLNEFEKNESEKILMKNTIESYKEAILVKEEEIVSLKDELYSKALSKSPVFNSSKNDDANVAQSNTLFDELKCLKLEEVTRDKEKFKQKYKSTRKDLSNAENEIKDLNSAIAKLKHRLHNLEANEKDLLNDCSNKKKEVQELRKKNNMLENKIKELHDSVKDKEYRMKSLCSDLNKKEIHIKDLSNEMETIKKAKIMIELILTKTNTEIEALHEENNKQVHNLLSTIEKYKLSEDASKENILQLANTVNDLKADLENKMHQILFCEKQLSENCQILNTKEEQLAMLYQEKLMVESQLNSVNTEIEKQQKLSSTKIRELENCLEYHLDELKNALGKIEKMEEKINSKQKQVDQYVEQITKQKEFINELECVKCKLNTQITNLDDQLLKKNCEAKDLEEKIKYYLLTLEKKQNELDDSVAMVNENTRTISNLKQQKLDIENELKFTVENLMDKTNKLKLLEEKLSNSELDNKNLKKELEVKILEADNLRKDLEITVNNMKNQQDIYDKQLKEIKSNLETSENKIIEQANELEKNQNCLKAKNIEIGKKTDLIKKQKENITCLQTQRSDLEEKLEGIEQCLLKKETEVSNLENNLQEKDVIIKNLEDQLGVMSIEKVMLETNLNETFDQIKKSRDDFTQQVNDMMSQLNNRAEEIGRLKNHSSNLESLLQERKIELDDQITMTLDQIEVTKNIKIEKELLENQIYNANECISTLQNEIKSLEEKQNECETCIQKLEQRLNDVSFEKTSLENNLQNSVSKTVVEELNEQIKDLNNNLENRLNEIGELRKSLSEMDNDLNQKQINFEHVIQENDNLKTTINFYESENNELQNSLGELKNYLTQTNENIALLQNEISASSSSRLILEQQLVKVHEALNNKSIEFENQIRLFEELKEKIGKMSDEREINLSKIKSLEDNLSHKEYEFNLSEGKLYDCSITIDDLENKLDAMKKENISLALRLDENQTLLISAKEDLTRQLEVQEQLNAKQRELENEIKLLNDQISVLELEKDGFSAEIAKLNNLLKTVESDLSEREQELEHQKSCLQSENDEHKLLMEIMHQESTKCREEIEEKLSTLQEHYNQCDVELTEQLEITDKQKQDIALLNLEKDNLSNEINMLKDTIKQKDCVLGSNQNKLLEYEEQNDNLITEKASLEVELSQSKLQLENIRLELTKRTDEMAKELLILQERLISKEANLEMQVKECDEKVKIISVLTSEKDNLIIERNSLQDCLLEKESTLALNQEKLNKHIKSLEELQIEKEHIELELNETKKHIENIQQDLTRQIEMSKSDYNELKQHLERAQLTIEEQKAQYVEHIDMIAILKSENTNLIDKISTLEQLLLQNDSESIDFKDKCERNENRNLSLITELNELKSQLKTLHEESAQQITCMNNELTEVQNDISFKQSDLKKQLELKYSSLSEIYWKINDLKNVKSELEELLKNEKINFENCLNSYTKINITNISVKPEPLDDDHQDSLMEVITSADTFIEQNGIQLGQVDNINEYSIIERLKKLFEALKLFIININTQSSGRAIIHTENQLTDEAYAELLAKSNSQQETIKYLEAEMLKLKTECNYKMTKVQQKTQEYVTSEYEKKFERKREQMKQFCKDLETKIHQDYEAKLMKYKEKINKDEIHIKELGQQLWEVSEKYLRLQQKDRRESTASLPFDISNISSMSKYNSNTLPKSSSASQIRSLVDESYQNKRNVPSGIGKIFPKEEDEEGEMFNHSCLADLKQGKVRLNDNNGKQYSERLSELQARNSLCPPHLRSCYAVETNYLPNASLITEEDIKTISSYSDCESENLIPNDRKKKDRNQTSYKKPGPPTPSKNGGRVSLSGNAKTTLKETKESNSNRRRASSTPNKLFGLFMSKKN
ncbi:putative leucine-rich repeat-containing protein DDB_G0290503 isoform X2 [Adelges cooleyi]|uniref:putative leucine-rich repeat-containing protein DDB_G0290503 isoform X2 n=1 Tax=Adelges cooleyi TaxID=133065 RepID=UPI0021803827|nr:putative leucine-rich repeat-containing protein DDB_G0290503 isoform X2 [Adelges cooleyi]